MSEPSNSAEHLVLAALESELEARERQQRGTIDSAIELARRGDVRPLVNLQWPGVTLDDWQWDILESLFDPSIFGVWVKGATGSGKGASAGIACCLYFAIWDDAKIVVTRDSADTAVRIAWGEIEKWYRAMRFKPPGRPMVDGLVDSKQHLIIVANPRHDEGFRGSHSPHVLFWFDEATAGNLEGKFRLAFTQAKKFLALANPSTLGGNFRDTFQRASDPNQTQTITDTRGRQRLITVSGWDLTNVRQKCLDGSTAPVGGVEIAGHKYRHGESISPEHQELCRPIIPGQTCYDEFMALLNDPDPFVRNVFALGQFPEDDPKKQIILGAWVDRCVARWLWADSLLRAAEKRPPAFREWLAARLLPVECFGLDVAASAHGDETVLVPGGRLGIRSLETCQFRDTQQTVAWVLETATRYGIDLTRGSVPVGIDYGGGYGNAVGDPLRTRGVRVIEIRGGSSPEVDPQRYGNRRAELYGEFGRRIDPAGDFAESPYAVPADSMLRAELVAPQKVFSGQDGQKFFLTPKTRKGASAGFKGRTIEEQIGRSPDRADAVVNCLAAVPHIGADLSQWLEAGAW